MNPFQVRLMASLETCHWWYRATHQLVLDALLAFSDRSARILDVGCGTGGLLRHLRSFHFRAGLEPDPGALRFARRRESPGLGPEYLLGDIQSLSGLEAAPFDCVTCVDVLYHRQVENWQEALAVMVSKLRTGGLLVLQVPAWECLSGAHDRAVDGVRRFRREPVEQFLGGIGFEILVSSYRFSWLFPGMFFLRGWERLFKKKRLHSNDLTRFSRSLRPFGRAAHQILLGIALCENSLLLSGFRFPVGSSLFVVARKRVAVEETGSRNGPEFGVSQIPTP